ncbi:MAG: hypothetical protein JXA60_04205 [Candidatus Coatesbacteria bacterium]|nr:hypothetical protein [Candidatus Coatesbacteria bacterium]
MKVIILICLLSALIMAEEKYFDRLGYDEVKNQFIGNPLEKPPAHGIYYKVILNEIGKITEIWRMDGSRLSSNQFGIAKQKFRYNDKGLPVEKSFYDDKDNPTNGQGGIHRTIALYDKNGWVIEEENLKSDGSPALPIARKTFKYDEQGRVIEEAYFGLEGKPIQGLARRVYKYNEKNLISVSGFDGSGLPYADKYGIITVFWTYDKDGRRTEEGYLGTGDKPILNPFGFAKFQVVYDSQGRMIEKKFLDGNNNLINNKDGIAKIKRLYDEKGRLKEVVYYNASEIQANNKERFSKETYDYIDDQDHYIYKCIDANGKTIKIERHIED